MNLNKQHKTDIVRAIMADIPVCDYKRMIRDYVQDEALKLMPAAVLAVYKDEGMRPFAATVRLYGRYYESSGDCGQIYWMCADAQVSRTVYLLNVSDRYDPLTETLRSNVRAKVTELCNLAEKQQKDRISMREKLQTMLLGIRTLKQAKTMLEADLHKYLPVEPPKDPKDASASVALVPYVVDGLKAMGWPKEPQAAA